MKLPYAGQLTWLPERTILWTTAGSRAYGTHRPDSDVDMRGICVPPRRYRDGILEKFEQCEGPWDDDLDASIYGIQKFAKLAAECNPNVIELLFGDPEDALINAHGALLVENRDLFLSQKARDRFRGYAMAQLKRIRTHRGYVLNPLVAPPDRADFGLEAQPVIDTEQRKAAFASIRKKIDSWEIDFGELDAAAKIRVFEQIKESLGERYHGSSREFYTAGNSLGFETNFLEELDKERRFKQAVKKWKQYQDWKKNRNPARAAMEARFGYDGKHALHLVRLMTMCREILTGQGVIVRRPDAEFLKGLLRGEWSYEQLLEWADQQDKELLTLKSPLPKKPNFKRIDELVQGIIQEHNKTE